MLSRFFTDLWSALCRLCLLVSVGICLAGLVAMICRFPLPGLVLCLGVLWRNIGRPAVSTNYGSASTASNLLLEREGMLGRDGLILGRCLPEKPSKRRAALALLNPRVRSELAVRLLLAAFLHRSWAGSQFIRVTNYVHLASFSPAGGGKGTSVLVPNLRSHPGSCVVTDPKPELVGLTAKFRRRRFGHKIIVLDPFGWSGWKSDTLNPLQWIDNRANDYIDQCRELANSLTERTGKETDPHWTDSCELVLTAMIAFVCGCESDLAKRNLQTVRKLVSSRQAFEKAVEVMQQTTACQGVVARLGGQLTWFQDKELGSVLTTVQRMTNFLDSPVIAANTNASSFDPMILRKRRATVYLILPPDRLQSHAGVLRTQIATIMRRITNGPPTEKNPVLWLLDEYAHLGRIRAIEDAVTLKRGMGMRLWFFLQSREQLKTCFGDKAIAIADNIGTQQYFNLTSYETCEDVSKRIGDATIATQTSSWSRSSSRPTGGKNPGDHAGNVSSSETVNRSEMARRLAKPEELLQLNDTMIVFHRHLPVILAQPVKWFKAPEFRRGGTGRQGGLGLAGGVVAAAMLALSLAFGNLAAEVASMPPVTRGPMGRDLSGMPAFESPHQLYRRFR